MGPSACLGRFKGVASLVKKFVVFSVVRSGTSLRYL